MSLKASRLLPHTGDFQWAGVVPTDYKESGDFREVTRRVFVGDQKEPTSFHVRYFEVAPGGFTTLEHHEHAHCVVVLRGCGEVMLNCQTHPLRFADVLYVAPWESHQLRNPHPTEPFGFLCIVDAVRDRPQDVTCA
ncbi:MAG: cupin domain-containing protein [Candidatus Xenobium sp.]|jgi:quercetin dioxygenase-like cupin family protein|nr:cupin domain-containing protein [Burkholderiales bacterium]